MIRPQNPRHKGMGRMAVAFGCSRVRIRKRTGSCGALDPKMPGNRKPCELCTWAERKDSCATRLG
jgi:hypothetical protein